MKSINHHLTILLILVGAASTHAGAPGVPHNGIHRLARATLNSGDDARPAVTLCASDGQEYGLRAHINLAEPICASEALINGTHRLRVGLLYPRPPAEPIPCNTIESANPPLDNPYLPGNQPFRDVLQDVQQVGMVLIHQGIGGVLTPDQGPIEYAPINLTFRFPLPQPIRADQVQIACSNTTSWPCPMVESLTEIDDASYALRLSDAIPPGGCTEFTFTGVVPPVKLRYEFLPADCNMSGLSNTQDLLGLVQALNNSTANLPMNLARYDVNRNGVANTQDLLRKVQLLNGTRSTRPWNGVALTPCP